MDTKQLKNLEKFQTYKRILVGHLAYLPMRGLNIHPYKL